MSDIQNIINQSTGVVGDLDAYQSEFKDRFKRAPSVGNLASRRNQGDFATQIDRFVVDTERKLLSVMQIALTDLTNTANNAKPDGRLPKKTGFLQHSAAAAVNARPIGPTKGDKKLTYTFDVNQVLQVIDKIKIGDTFYFGWTAEYARVQEARNGFLEGAVMKWQSFVNAAVSRLR